MLIQAAPVPTTRVQTRSSEVPALDDALAAATQSAEAQLSTRGLFGRLGFKGNKAATGIMRGESSSSLPHDHSTSEAGKQY